MQVVGTSGAKPLRYTPRTARTQIIKSGGDRSAIETTPKRGECLRGESEGRHAFDWLQSQVILARGPRLDAEMNRFPPETAHTIAHHSFAACARQLRPRACRGGCRVAAAGVAGDVARAAISCEGGAAQTRVLNSVHARSRVTARGERGRDPRTARVFMCACVRMRVCVCVCERERETERGEGMQRGAQCEF